MSRFSHIKRLSISLPLPEWDLPGFEVDYTCYSELVKDLLHNTPMPNLKDLNLEMYCTHDFTILLEDNGNSGAARFRTLLHALRRLSLSVTDKSGPGGAKVGHLNPLPSRLQLEYPNAAHAQGLFELAALAGNVEGLRISGSHILPAQLRDFTHMNLKELSLTRVKFDADAMVTLLQRNMQTLSLICLVQVELTSGVWVNPFIQLAQCPKLLGLQFLSLTYDFNGESSEFAPSKSPSASVVKRSIRSALDEDRYALGDLQRFVINNREKHALIGINSADYDCRLLPTMKQFRSRISYEAALETPMS